MKKFDKNKAGGGATGALRLVEWIKYKKLLIYYGTKVLRRTPHPLRAGKQLCDAKRATNAGAGLYSVTDTIHANPSSGTTCKIPHTRILRTRKARSEFYPLPQGVRESHAPKAVTTIKPFNRSTPQPRKRCAAQIIRDAAKTRFRRTLRAGLLTLAPCRKFGFTLPEILITLLIIGIVAALTIPNLISSYKKSQTITKLKKTYSVLNQVFLMSEAQNSSSYNSFENPKEYLDTYWRPYVKISKECQTGVSCGYSSNHPFKYIDGSNQPGEGILVYTADNRLTFLTNDNVLFCVLTDTGVNASFPHSFIYVDINGANEPNLLGKDVFVFERVQGKTVQPVYHNNSDSYINENCKKYGLTCLEKIIREGWKISDDYPW